MRKLQIRSFWLLGVLLAWLLPSSAWGEEPPAGLPSIRMLYSASNPQEVNLNLSTLDRGIWFRNADGSVTKLTDGYAYNDKQHLALPQGEVWFYGKFEHFYILKTESLTVEGFAFNDLESDKWSQLKRLEIKSPCKANIIQLPKNLTPQFNSLTLEKNLNNALKFVGWDTDGQSVGGNYWSYLNSEILAETYDQLFHNLTARDGYLKIGVPDNNDEVKRVSCLGQGITMEGKNKGQGTYQTLYGNVISTETQKNPTEIVFNKDGWLDFEVATYDASTNFTKGGGATGTPEVSKKMVVVQVDDGRKFCMVIPKTTTGESNGEKLTFFARGGKTVRLWGDASLLKVSGQNVVKEIKCGAGLRNLVANGCSNLEK